MNAAQFAIQSALNARTTGLWVLQPDRLRALQSRLRTLELDVDTIDSMKAKYAAASNKKTSAKKVGRAAFISVVGTLVHREDWLSKYLGECGCDEISRQLDSPPVPESNRDALRAPWWPRDVIG